MAKTAKPAGWRPPKAGAAKRQASAGKGRAKSEPGILVWAPFGRKRCRCNLKRFRARGRRPVAFGATARWRRSARPPPRLPARRQMIRPPQPRPRPPPRHRRRLSTVREIKKPKSRARLRRVSRRGRIVLSARATSRRIDGVGAGGFDPSSRRREPSHCGHSWADVSRARGVGVSAKTVDVPLGSGSAERQNSHRSSARAGGRPDRRNCVAPVSTKQAKAAPRDKASRPSAPLPANRSATRRPSNAPMRLTSIENRVSRKRSAVGRVAVPGGGWSRRPRHSPAMILT